MVVKVQHQPGLLYVLSQVDRRGVTMATTPACLSSKVLLQMRESPSQVRQIVRIFNKPVGGRANTLSYSYRFLQKGKLAFRV